MMVRDSGIIRIQVLVILAINWHSKLVEELKQIAIHNVIKMTGTVNPIADKANLKHLLHLVVGPLGLNATAILRNRHINKATGPSDALRLCCR